MENIKNSYYIYIIQEREFIRIKEETYKVGITQDIIRRYSEYPKSSKLIYTRVCDTNFEKEILKFLKEKFIQKREYGTEYFEGDYNEIINCINKIIDEKQIKILKNDIIKSKTGNYRIENHYYICSFLNEQIKTCQKSILKPMDVYSEFKIWYELNAPREKIPKMNEIKEFIIDKFGKPNKDGNWDNLDMIRITDKMSDDEEELSD